MRAGIVIRADGTVPFDHDASEEFALRKRQTISWLIEDGHQVGPHPENPQHLQIAVWPPAHDCQLSAIPPQE